MALPFYNWSKTAANNANADSTVNWNEGQAPSSVNDSARAMMASTAAFRDDISGGIVTGGTATAYTLTSNQVFSTAAKMDNAMLAFVPHVDCGLAPTINVDGIGARFIRASTGKVLTEGSLVAGTPYVVTYDNTTGEMLLHNIAGNPYNVPLAAGMDYWAPIAPNSAFVFPVGQAISRTTYADLFALIGTTFGAGNGSTTFNLPDKRGRVSAAADGGAGRLTGASVNTVIAGGVGGFETRTLTQANLPSVNFAVSSGSLSVTSTVSSIVTSTFGTTSLNATAGGSLGAFASSGGNTTTAITSTGTVTGQAAASGGSSSPVVTLQPTILCNYIIRII